MAAITGITPVVPPVKAYSITAAKTPGNAKPTNVVDFGWVCANRNMMVIWYQVAREWLQKPRRFTSSNHSPRSQRFRLSQQQLPHYLLNPTPFRRLPQPLPYLSTRNRNRQPWIPLPQVIQLPLNTSRRLPTRIRYRRV